MIQGTDADKINLLKELFDGEVIQQPDETTPSPDDRTALLPEDNEIGAFLDERKEFREKMHQELSIDSYLQHYDEICRFGLDEYFMDLLKWEINLKIGNDPDHFYSHDFELNGKSQKEMVDLINRLHSV